MNFAFFKGFSYLRITAHYRKNTQNYLFLKNIKFLPKSVIFFRTMASIDIKTSFFGRSSDQDFDTINVNFIKSENDTMEYRLIELRNGLRALLVSDVKKLIEVDSSLEVKNADFENEPEVYAHDIETDESEEDDTDIKHSGKEHEEKMAACSLCVGVGSFSDPPDIPGLAHFLEHMVFMGSIKYPKENGFDEFIKKHGGSDNGSTDCETTTFYLECSEKYLKEGMDRFAQFFISPLMKREAMTREREAVHSEFEMSLLSDGSRREQILGTFAPSGHPASKFQWGNLVTLGRNIYEDILYDRIHEFRLRHYSAHRMTVAVQARLSLDTLEKYVVNSFGEIPSNNLPPDDFSSYINTYGTTSSFNKLVWIKPVRDVCQVHLTWVLPSYLVHYSSRPLDYVAWLVGHEGEGSLLSYLRKKVWALECVAGNDESGFEHNSIYAYFSITVTLTEKGYKNLGEVIESVFNYIDMLKNNIPSNEIFEELQTICKTNFRFKTEIPAASYVEILSESMQYYQAEHFLAGGELYFTYSPELITDVLKHLVPDKVNVIVYDKELQESFYDKVEPWFQTKYKVEEIPSDWRKKWNNATTCNDFHIPNPNPYLVNDFSLLPGPTYNPPYPVKIMNTDLLEIWYRQDIKFKQPLAYFSFYIVSPILKSEVLNAVLLDVLAAYLETKFTESLFPANQAGLYCTYMPSDLGLYLQFNGYSQKLPLLFDQVLKLMFVTINEIAQDENEELFLAVKKGRSRAYYNKLLKPRKLVKMARLSLLIDCYWTSAEYLEVMHLVNLQRLQNFANDFFGNVKIIGLIQGNVSRQSTEELCQKFEGILQCSPLKGNKPHVRVSKLHHGESILRLKSFNENDANSVVVNYYQVGETNIRSSCLVDLLMMIMDEPLFDTLRTKQQIGYDVHCMLRDTFGVLGFSIAVFFQSHKFSADEVEERIEKFLHSFLETLKGMSKKDWEEAKSSLILLKSAADLQLQDEVKRNFSEICANEYMFNRLQKEVDAIPDITHKELANWFAHHIGAGKKFKKLSVQVVGEIKPNTSEENANANANANTHEKTNSSTNAAADSHEEKNTNIEGSFSLKPLRSENDRRNNFIMNIEDYKSSRDFYPIKKI